MKSFMYEKKTTLLSIENQDLKTVKAETEKINDLLPKAIQEQLQMAQGLFLSVNL